MTVLIALIEKTVNTALFTENIRWSGQRQTGYSFVRYNILQSGLICLE